MTNEIKYTTEGTASGWAVVRDDGAIAEFLSSQEAQDAADLLNAGDAAESDYEWLEDVDGDRYEVSGE